MHWTPRTRGMSLSALVHLGALLGLGVGAVFWPEPLPDPANPVRIVILDPAAAAAPPLPKGILGMRLLERTKPMTPDPTPQPDTLMEPRTPDDARVRPDGEAPADDPFGSETGSDSGITEGTDDGIEEGRPGGIPGGDPDGCVGCIGAGPVLDYDQAPRAIKLTKPVYPQGAFMKKIEGVVTVQFLIDTSGQPVHVRVIQSIPMLDQAAIETVQQWRFAPAVKKGRAVTTLATAPVSFRIF